MAAAADQDLPEFYHFPPFFTLQPVLETRKMQLKLWHDFILKWHQAKGIQNLSLNEWPLFSNPAIERTLSLDARREVVQGLVATGHAEWRDESRLTCLLMWSSPQELAASIYAYVRANGMTGNVYTVYELHSGDEATLGPEFQGMDPTLMHKALEVLEREGKAAFFKGSTPEAEGIKFFEV